MPTAPDYLSSAALVWWTQVWTAGRAWLSSDVDRLLVTRLCVTVGDLAAIRAEFAGGLSHYYAMSDGVIAVHPAVKRTEILEELLSSLMGMIGFSPADRTRLGLKVSGARWDGRVRPSAG